MYIVPTDIKLYKIIDWSRTLEDIGNDTDFLQDIMNDLFVEVQECYRQMLLELMKNNFTKIYDNAHRIKGSAMYLRCEQLKHCAQHIELLSKNVSAQTLTEDQRYTLSVKLREWLTEYDNVIVRLREEYSSYFLVINNANLIVYPHS